jgi:ABC-type phosphate transport system permease subunit
MVVEYNNVLILGTAAAIFNTAPLLFVVDMNVEWMAQSLECQTSLERMRIL